MLSACGSTPTLPQAASGPADAPVVYPRTRGEVRAYPFGQLGVRMDQAPPAILSLISSTGPDDSWAGSDARELRMRNGRIVSVETPELMYRQSPPDQDPLERAIDGQEIDTTWYPLQLEIRQGNVPPQRLAARCQLQESAPESLLVQGKAVQARALTENCVIEGQTAGLLNRYWVPEGSRHSWSARLGLPQGDGVVAYDLLKAPR